MRYAIIFDKVVNQLIPHYLGGRKLILYLQALMKPLQQLNESFVSYAKETRIEASMTSKIFYFEWYLNRKFSKYFLEGGKISLTNGKELGVPFYAQNAAIPIADNPLFYNESENRKTVALYYADERTTDSGHSFVVSSPAINTNLITEGQYRAMLKSYIDKYRLAGKTYIIKINT